jgi:uncharacterized protein (DUF433 family)
MLENSEKANRVRVQVDLTKAEAALMDLLQRRLSVRSRADLLQQAYGTFLWVVDEMLSNRRIISVEPDAMDCLPRYKELSLPAVQPLVFEHYQHLVTRPEKGRRQPYLKGRNMTVGQLIYQMRTNKLTAEQAVEEFSLPLEQVREAQTYYEVHRDVIEAEAEEDKRLRLPDLHPGSIEAAPDFDDPLPDEFWAPE